MKKEHSYVKCQGCNWHLENNTGRDWAESPCKQCKNTRKVIDPREILCNLCGECMCPIGTMNEQYPHGLFEASVAGGYDSYHLLDMTRYTFSFCEKCLRQLFMQCKIKPLLESAGRDKMWEDDQKSYEYHLWTDGGGAHQAYLDGKCNAVKDCLNAASFTVFLSDHFTEDACCEEHKARWTNCMNAELKKFIPNVLKPFL